VSTAAAVARAGAEATKTMSSEAGRSNYIGGAVLQGTPDPGAVAVAEAFSAAAVVLG
jgi:dihydroxyacetone kinase